MQDRTWFATGYGRSIWSCCFIQLPTGELRLKKVGVIGTMVWDTIYGRGAELEPANEWGGISYALAALDAALPDDWRIVPLVKVGSDLVSSANEFLNTLSHCTDRSRFIEVPQPNNRVTLQYNELERCTEQLSGGVPAWTWEELGPMVQDLDAVYVNFISGFEMQLVTALQLRRGFRGPIYVDLHSLFLGVECDGLRVPEALVDVSSWFSCFDVVQLNEAEMSLVGSDPIEVAARAMVAGVRLLLVTLGERGALYFSDDSIECFEELKEDRICSGPIRTARIPAEHVPEPLDPTGCGDVFGAAIVSYLLSGSSIEEAIESANTFAAANLRFRGATRLHEHLRG